MTKYLLLCIIYSTDVERAEKMNKKIKIFIEKILHVLEVVIAITTLVVMVGLLGYEIYKMFTVDNYFASNDTFLHAILTIVVGLEFVRMLIDLTPANTLEVIILALSKSIIVHHENAISNIAFVLCIAGLCAIRKFLVKGPEDEKPKQVEEETEEKVAELTK